MHYSEITAQSALTRREREPKTCLLELVQIIMRGIYPSEQQLEHLLDQIEGTP